MSSVTVYLKGMRKVDDDFEKMIRIRDACYDVGLECPQAVIDYFEGDPDDDKQELFNRKFSFDIVSVDGGSGNVNSYGTNMDLVDKVESLEMVRRIDINLKKLPTSVESLRLELYW